MNKLTKILLVLAAVALAVGGVDYLNTRSAVKSLSAEHGSEQIGANVAHSTTNITGGHTNATTSTAGFMSAADKTLIDQLFAGPRFATYENDEFLTGGTTAGSAALVGTGVSATFGKLNWRGTTGGTGAAINAVTTGQTTAHWAVIELQPGSTTTGTAGISRNPASTAAGYTFGSGQVFANEYWAQFPVLSDGTNTYTATFGWAQSSVLAPTDGCTASYSSAAPQSGTLICRACSSSACTNGTGGSPPTVVAATWYRIRTTWDGTNCGCTVDGTNIGSTSSNVPTTNAITDIAGIIDSAGTGTNDKILLDYYQSSRIVAAGR